MADSVRPISFFSFRQIPIIPNIQDFLIGRYRNPYMKFISANASYRKLKIYSLNSTSHHCQPYPLQYLGRNSSIRILTIEIYAAVSDTFDSFITLCAMLIVPTTNIVYPMTCEIGRYVGRYFHAYLIHAYLHKGLTICSL